MTSFQVQAEVEEKPSFLFGKSYTVWAVWSSPAVDRPKTSGWSCNDRSTRERLVRAINDQKVFVNARVATDVGGKTYVEASSNVSGKYFNQDLKQIGY